MLKRFIPKSALLVLFIVAVLSGCSLPKKSDDSEFDRPPLSYEQYEKMLLSAKATEKDSIRLNMAELLLIDKNYEALGALTGKIDSKALSLNDRLRFMCVESRRLAATGKIKEALATLPKNQKSFPPAIQRRVLAAQIDVFANEYPLKSLEARAERQTLLTNSQDLYNSGIAIVDGLQSLPESTLLQYLKKKPETPLTQWVSFVNDVQPQWLSEQEFENKLGQWLFARPAHTIPNDVIEALRKRARTATGYPKKVALLLPLTGRYAAQANSIREGFVAAYYADSPLRKKPEVLVVDTSKSTNIIEQLEEAKQAGAGLVVGPLLKSNIEKLASQSRLPLTVLALNRVSALNAKTTRGLYQFGLMPEDEAEQAAEYASAKRLNRAAILVPRSIIGRRMKKRFSERLNELGGQLVVHSDYPAGTRDFSGSIKSILDIQQSNSRKDILRSVLRIPLEFEHSMRSDLDTLYIVAGSNAARSIKPQLKFYDAEKLPVIASSQSYNGRSNPMLDKDIEGVNFVQTPWLLKEQDSELYKTLKKLNPRKFSRMNTLYAMGADAYHLIPKLKRMRENTNANIDGHTGRLFVQPNGIVKRRLLWATFTAEGIKINEKQFIDAATQDTPEQN